MGSREEASGRRSRGGSSWLGSSDLGGKTRDLSGRPILPIRLKRTRSLTGAVRVERPPGRVGRIASFGKGREEGGCQVGPTGALPARSCPFGSLINERTHSVHAGGLQTERTHADSR